LYNGENDRVRNQIFLSEMFYGATVISISDNHIHVCECSIHFPISAKTFSPKYFVPYEINYFTQSNMDISTSRYMSPSFFLLAPLHT